MVEPELQPDFLEAFLAEVLASADADQPDPVTLTEPTYDEEGRLRWASVGADRGLGGLGLRR